MKMREGERTYSCVRVGTKERVSMLRIRKEIDLRGNIKKEHVLTRFEKKESRRGNRLIMR